MSAPIACRPLMCWSTGREPIAQPPGSDTVASPKRASSGPSTMMLARIVLTRSYGASGVLSPLASTTTSSTRPPSVSAPQLTSTPMLRISLSTVATSCSRGTLCSVTGPGTSSAAHSSGSAAFLAPEIVTSPWRRRPPRIRSLSMVGVRLGKRVDGPDGASARARPKGRAGASMRMAGGVAAERALAGPLGRRQRLHRQRVDLLAHAVAERGIHALVAADAHQAFEFRRHDGGEEMSAVALHLEVIAGESVGDVALDVLGGGIGHGIRIIPQAAGIRARKAPMTTASSSNPAAMLHFVRRGQDVDTSSTALI